MYYCVGLTEKGNRPNNEDAFLINKSFFNDGNSVSYLSPPFVIAVADGVSGNNYGETASKICLSALKGIRCSSMALLTPTMRICRQLYVCLR